jgi:hypothetical protein
MEILQKLKIKLPYNSTVPFPCEDTIKPLAQHVYCSTIHNIQALETAQMPHN